MMQTLKLLLLSIAGVWGLLASSSVFAQADVVPIDPLIRSEAASSGFELGLGFSYVPSLEEGLALDEGVVSTYAALSRQFLVPIHLRYRLSETHSFSTVIESKISLVQTAIRGYNGSTTTSSRTTLDNNFTFGLRQRLAPTHPSDPTIDVSLDTPQGIAGVGLSGSWIADPVVLSATLTHSTHLGVGGNRLTLGLGLGFYVNDRIRFHATTHHGTPIGHVALPSWIGSFNVVYALDMRSNNDLSIGIMRTKRGNEDNVGFQLAWTTR